MAFYRLLCCCFFLGECLSSSFLTVSWSRVNLSSMMATLPNLKTLFVLIMKSNKLFSFALLQWVMDIPEDLWVGCHQSSKESTGGITLQWVLGLRSICSFIRSFIFIGSPHCSYTLCQVRGMKCWTKMDQGSSSHGVSCPIRDKGQREAVFKAIKEMYPEHLKRWPLLLWVVKECTSKKETCEHANLQMLGFEGL